MRRTRWRGFLATLLVLAVAGGCAAAAAPTPGAGTLASGAGGAPGSFVPLSPEDAVLAYGLGPTRDPRVTYQPDVVLVEGGPSIVRWASADGVTWAIDRHAPGAADLRVGSVMFATSAALGRVAAIEDQGDDRIVTLAPIDLTELVRDADLQVDQEVNLSAAAYHQLPADAPAILTEADSPPSISPSASPSPGADVVGPDGTIAVTLPPVRLAAFETGHAAVDPTLGGRLTVPGRVCPELGVGDWAVETCIQGRGVTLTIDRKASDHLKFGAVLKLTTSNLRVQAGTLVKDGQVVDSGGLLQGLDGFELSFHGGVENGAQDNAKVKIEVPLEIETGSIVVDGIPLKMLIEAKLTIETAFSGRNSTLSGKGTYRFEGPIGIAAGKPVTPGLSVVSSILDSLSGITVGASGVVVAAKWKFQGGVGLYGFTAGPYVTLTISAGIGQGSVIGAALAECKGATLGVWVGAGGGYNLNASKLQWLLGRNSVISKYLTTKLDIDLLQYQVVDRKAVSPDVPLCRG